MPLNSLNLIYYKFHIAQIIIIESIDNILKGALEVFLSVYHRSTFMSGLLITNQVQVNLCFWIVFGNT